MTRTNAKTRTRTRPAAARKVSPANGTPANVRLFSTPQARRIKKEICAVGRKLWLRQLVDGNGGNISYRIGPNEVICTPTMISKYDLTPADLCMVDLEGNQIAGKKAVTSEILLHLEIYKKVPEAKAAVHCHPAHATAYAITGAAPANLVLPEYEVFVGQVALAPYETPGTSAFAKTVLPYVENHNAVMLSNHGIICWAETVTKAEWQCEVLEFYCTVLSVAGQLGRPLSRIPEPKREDLRALRKSMGFPDAANGSAGSNGRGAPARRRNARWSEDELEAIVQRVTRQVLKEIGPK